MTTDHESGTGRPKVEQLTAHVLAAEPIRAEGPTPEGLIRIDPGLEWPGGRTEPAEYERIHREAAEAIWRVLAGTLAQGTLNRLLELMLVDRAGYRIVRRQGAPVPAVVTEEGQPQGAPLSGHRLEARLGEWVTLPALGPGARVTYLPDPDDPGRVWLEVGPLPDGAPLRTWLPEEPGVVRARDTGERWVCMPGCLALQEQGERHRPGCGVRA